MSTESEAGVPFEPQEHNDDPVAAELVDNGSTDVTTPDNVTSLFSWSQNKKARAEAAVILASAEQEKRISEAAALAARSMLRLVKPEERTTRTYKHKPPRQRMPSGRDNGNMVYLNNHRKK